MGKVFIVLTDRNELALRNKAKRKGDLSRLVNEALDKVFMEGA